MIEPFVAEGRGFRIRFDLHPRYLRAYVHDGMDSLDVSIAIWRMLAEQCRAHRMKRLLVLEDLSGTVPEPVGVHTCIEESQPRLSGRGRGS